MVLIAGLVGWKVGLAQESVRSLAAARLGPQAVQVQRSLEPLLTALDGDEELARVEAVNRFFNRHLRFAEDQQVWGVPDHWASPLQALARGEGDCEDYAIGKYFSLVTAGLPVQRLRLVYVRARLRTHPAPQAHMVLAYYPSEQADPLVLDNLMEAVLPASRRPDLLPVFSFNGEGLWQGGEPAGDPQRRISRWRDVAARAREEGFR